MWSGPRNISTAMMRSWENRPDCTVVDEPFYACYLRESGQLHPAREAILAAMPTARDTVITSLTVDDPGSELQYQKHMTHHMPDGTDLSWCAALHHCFLIRDPREVIASYLEKMPTVSSADIGIVRQAALFKEIREVNGRSPLVIDSNDVKRQPREILTNLCSALNIPFAPERMLQWPAGRRDSDGVWADHWYQSVEKSTGFAPYTPRQIQLSAAAEELAKAMYPYYEELARHKIVP